MNDRQTKALNEFRDIEGVLNNYPTEIANYGILQRKVQTYRGLINEISDVARQTASDTTGVTQSKSTIKTKMAVGAAELAFAGLSYAYDQQDLELQGVFSLTYSEVKYAKDEDALNITAMLLDDWMHYLQKCGRIT